MKVKSYSDQYFKTLQNVVIEIESNITKKWDFFKDSVAACGI